MSTAEPPAERSPGVQPAEHPVEHPAEHPDLPTAEHPDLPTAAEAIVEHDVQPSPESASARLAHLTKRERRLIVVRLVARVSVTTVLLLVVYYLAPFDRSVFDTGGATLALLVAGLVALIAMIVWQTRLIVNAEYPGVRAVEALAVITPFYLIVFAGTYLLLGRSEPSAFSEPLDRTSSLYFTVTVFATVGFGDITAKTQAARIVVMIQMLLDLLILGMGLRLFLTAVRVGQRRRDSRRADPDQH